MAREHVGQTSPERPDAPAALRRRTPEHEQVSLEHLNPAQREAVTHEGGPLLVIAGAGTGKTAVITERVAWLVRARGYRPDSILALTFTEKAAAEMEERIDRLLPMGYTQVWVETFHGFCERLLRETALTIGLDPAFRVLAVPQQWLLLRRHVFDLPLKHFRPLGNPTKFLRALVRAIGAAKDQDLTAERFETFAQAQEEAAEKSAEATARDALREEAARWREFAATYRTYNALLIRESVMDFGDLILNTLKLLQERPSVRQRRQEQFRAILVDEFQDTNGAQNELLQLLTGEEGNITVVGDDDQSIYAWRGSNITNILRFQQTYQNVRKIVLTENYRSPQNILDAAYLLIQQNNPYRLESSAGVTKKLASTRTQALPGRECVSHRHFQTAEQESRFIAETIITLVGENVCQYRDCAILTRTNAQADDIVPSLNQRDIPYHIAEARGLLLRPEVRDVAAYLRAVVDPDNTLAVFRLLALPVFGLQPFERQRLLSDAKRSNQSLVGLLRSKETLPGLSPQSRGGVITLLTLLEFDVTRAGSQTPSAAALTFLQKSGYLERLLKDERRAAEAVPNLTEFLNFMSEYERAEPEASLLGFVEFLDLVIASGESPAQAVLPPDVDAVRILTVHGAKGLEFADVFLPGATRDKYPVRDQTEPLELPDAFAPQQDINPRDAHILEERRLFYVAMTRAKERLIITSSERTGSQRIRRKPSPFITEAGIETRASATASPAQQLLLPMVDAPKPAAPTAVLTLPGTISVSQVSTYETCPLKYEFQYVYRVPSPPNHALTFGVTVHTVLRDLARLVAHGTTATVNDAVALYEKHWSSAGFETKEHEQQQKSYGRGLLTTYLESHPNLLCRAPLFAEESFRFHLGDFTAAGRIDRVDKDAAGRIAVTDFKTGSVRDEKDAKSDLQLSVYALALHEVFHLRADRLTLSFLDGGIDRHTTRTGEDLRQARERLLAAAERIRARAFGATPSYQACRFCEFRTICDSAAV